MKAIALLCAVLGTFACFQVTYMGLITDIISKECDSSSIIELIPSCGYRYAMVSTMIVSGLCTLIASVFGRTKAVLFLINHVIGWVAFLCVLIYIVGIFSNPYFTSQNLPTQ